MFDVYIIESLKDQKWYYGKTSTIERRLFEHNSGQTTSTKGKGPWQLIFKRTFPTNEEALKFEKELKRLRNKNYIRKTYSEYFLGV